MVALLMSVATCICARESKGMPTIEVTVPHKLDARNAQQRVVKALSDLPSSICLKTIWSERNPGTAEVNVVGGQGVGSSGSITVDSQKVRVLLTVNSLGVLLRIAVTQIITAKLKAALS